MKKALIEMFDVSVWEQFDGPPSTGSEGRQRSCDGEGDLLEASQPPEPPVTGTPPPQAPEITGGGAPQLRGEFAEWLQ